MALSLAVLGSPQARAERSSIDLAATLGGQIIGAAKACGINPERIRRTTERMASVVIAKASAHERNEVAAHFNSAQAAGAQQVRFEKSRCSSVHVDFAEMETKLGRAPSSDDGRVAVKRGVAPLGAIRVDSGIRSE